MRNLSNNQYYLLQKERKEFGEERYRGSSRKYPTIITIVHAEVIFLKVFLVEDV